MLYSATWSGMRTLAGDYREGDIRRATIARAAKAGQPEKTETAATSTQQAPASAGPVARLLTLLPHAR